MTQITKFNFEQIERALSLNKSIYDNILASLRRARKHYVDYNEAIEVSSRHYLDYYYDVIREGYKVINATADNHFKSHDECYWITCSLKDCYIDATLTVTSNRYYIVELELINETIRNQPRTRATFTNARRGSHTRGGFKVYSGITDKQCVYTALFMLYARALNKYNSKLAA